MKRHLLFLLSLLLVFRALAQPDSTQKIIPDRINSPEQQAKPYVILISGDGFRWDYAEKYGAVNLLADAASGVKAESMIPSYPSLTFPNHYTIVTGMYPSHHGLVGNGFYDSSRHESYAMRNTKGVRDGSWYGGTPLWVLAEQQKMVSASFYWVGSEANIQNTLPTYYYYYNEIIPIDRRVQIVTDWLNLPAEKRPHLITVYFPEVDHNGHTYGPESQQTAQAVRWLDSSILKLTNAVKTTGLPVNFIFVSDHGMTSIDTTKWLSVPSVDTSKWVVSGATEIVELYAKDKSAIQSTYENLKSKAAGYNVFLKTEMPDRLHYGVKDDWKNRIGDILIVPIPPMVFSLSGRRPNPGAHGFDPGLVKDMHATFYAWGPAFKSGVQIPSFENVNVYPIVAKILGLTISDKIDGTLEVGNQILK